MKTITDIVGNKYGRLTVIASAGYSSNSNAKPQWLCKCDCGNEYVGIGVALKNGNTASCGCLRRDVSRELNTTHGMKGTKIYNTWQAMLNRCKLPSNKSYHRYGGRGITVCDRWKSFENFLEDMGEPNKGESIDRINNDGNYEPSNCKWSDDKTQSRNKSTNVWLEANGTTMIMADWAKRLGCHSITIKARLARGWNVIDAVTKPIKSKGVTV